MKIHEFVRHKLGRPNETHSRFSQPGPAPEGYFYFNIWNNNIYLKIEEASLINPAPKDLNRSYSRSDEPTLEELLSYLDKNLTYCKYILIGTFDKYKNQRISFHIFHDRAETWACTGQNVSYIWQESWESSPGVKDRRDGPAHIVYDIHGVKQYEHYYVDGVNLTKDFGINSRVALQNYILLQ